MVPDLGRIIRLSRATLIAFVALRLTLGRWRRAFGIVLAFWTIVLVGARLLRLRRPIAPDDWPPPAPGLVLATGDGVWRVHLPSGQAYPASSIGQPTVALALDGDALRATEPLTYRSTRDWRQWDLTWPKLGSVTWQRPTLPPALRATLTAAALPGRAHRVTALLPGTTTVPPRAAPSSNPPSPAGAGASTDGAQSGHAVEATSRSSAATVPAAEAPGHYIATAPFAAELALKTLLARPTGPIADTAKAILARRWGRLYHLDTTGIRRLIAAGLPPIFAILEQPSTGPLAGPPAAIHIRPIPTGPEPKIVIADPAPAQA